MRYMLIPVSFCCLQETAHLTGLHSLLCSSPSSQCVSALTFARFCSTVTQHVSSIFQICSHAANPFNMISLLFTPPHALRIPGIFFWLHVSLWLTAACQGEQSKEPAATDTLAVVLVPCMPFSFICPALVVTCFSFRLVSFCLKPACKIMIGWLNK